MQNLGKILAEAGVEGAREHSAVLKRYDMVAPTTNEEVRRVVGSTIGLIMGLASGCKILKLTPQHMAVFIRNTPGGKGQGDLWDEFRSRQQRHEEDQYLFHNFMAEVIAEAGYPPVMVPTPMSNKAISSCLSTDAVDEAPRSRKLACKKAREGTPEKVTGVE